MSSKTTSNKDTSSDKLADQFMKQEECLKKCQWLIDSKLNKEDFICEVEKHGSIWNCFSDDYNDKLLKSQAWTQIVCTFIQDFDELPEAERNTIVTLIQRKWKSIRSCYTRELLRLKGAKNGATRRKQYTYFDRLRFLETTVKHASTHVDEEEIEEEGNVNLVSLDSKQIKNIKSKKRNSDAEIMEVIKKNNKSSEDPQTLSKEDADEDKLFLLSMLSEIHKVPPERKLKLRADIISLVAAAQTPVQGCQDHYAPIFPVQGPSTQHQHSVHPPVYHRSEKKCSH